MGIFSDFMKNIGEDERWSGRTQSGVSWSPEQLRRDFPTVPRPTGISNPQDLPVSRGHSNVSPPMAQHIDHDRFRLHLCASDGWAQADLDDGIVTPKGENTCPSW
jgi:hypothetical protein